MLSFSVGGYAIRICTNCCVLSHLPWAWERSALTGWLIRFALPHSPFVFKGTVMVFQTVNVCSHSLRCQRMTPPHMHMNKHRSYTNQLAGNHGECRKQCRKSGSNKRPQMLYLRCFPAHKHRRERRVGSEE